MWFSFQAVLNTPVIIFNSPHLPLGEYWPMILSAVTWYFGFWVLFQSVLSLAGWNFYELTFVFAISLTAFGFQDFFCTRLWSLDQELMEGSFITNYFKPLNILFCYLSGRLGFFSIARMLCGVVALIYSIIKLQLVSFVLAYQVWRAGINSYSGTGT